MELLNIISNSLDIFLLIFTRMVGIFLTAPFFSRKEIPYWIKVMTAFFMTYILLPSLAGSANINQNIINILFLGLKEFIIGVSIGLSSQMLFNVFLAAGALSDLQMGLSMAQEVDPTTGSQITNTGSLFVAFAYVLFLVTDAHYLFIRAIMNSYDILPIGHGVFYTSNFLNYIIKVVLSFAQNSLLLIMPIMIVLFLGNLLLAFMAKVMPQMNVFIVGMPFKILIGFITLVIIIPHMKDMTMKVFEEMIKSIYMFLRVLGQNV